MRSERAVTSPVDDLSEPVPRYEPRFISPTTEFRFIQQRSVDGTWLTCGGDDRLRITEPNASDGKRAQMGLRAAGGYQPGKIPVTFIHVLLSDAMTWDDVIEQFETDAQI